MSTPVTQYEMPVLIWKMIGSAAVVIAVIFCSTTIFVTYERASVVKACYEAKYDKCPPLDAQ